MRTILIVEDNKINRDMLSRRLERKGYRVLSACDGREGVAQATSHRPDIVLMDMSMPVMDGWEATRQLKASAATRSIPVIALTAHAMLGDREKALEAGCDDYEMKPVELSRLLIKVESLFDKRSQPVVAAERLVFTLLIVDDNEMNREVLSRRLQLPEYRVVKAKSGKEALNIVAERTIDLVLLDSMMPEMSGLEVLQTIRSQFSIIELPVIMVTAKEQTEDTVTALELGANDYLTKPLNFPVVLARIHTQLSLKRAHLAVNPQRSAAAANTARQPLVATPAPALVETPAPATKAAQPRRPSIVWKNTRETAPLPRLVKADSLSASDSSTRMTAPRLASAASVSASDSNSRIAVIDPPANLQDSLIADADLEVSNSDTWHSGLTQSDFPRLNGYKILSELGRGGMGVVYKARHERMNRLVAIKVIDKDHWASPDAIRRFYREIQAAAQLSSPNIVLAHDAGKYDDTHYFVMEYVEGVDLGTLVKQRGPLSVEDACHCIRQTAAGLQHAYDKGMVHRDIKPANLLATWPSPVLAPNRPPSGNGQQQTLGNSVIKILDMGLALLHQPTELSEAVAALTRDNRVVGTADYMAPEQWMNAHKVDIRADLYSLGCTFYHLLTGEVPFPSVEPMEKMLKHHLDEPETLEKCRPGIPGKVSSTVRRLMAKKPEHRFETPADLIAALS